MNLRGKPFYLSDESVSWVNETLKSMSEEEKIAQLFCLVAYSSDENYLNYLSKKLKVGGIMCRTMPSDEVVKTVTQLQGASKIPMLISANLENGGCGVATDGTRLGCEMAVAATNDPEYGKLLGKICGKEGAALGVNWSFAPIVDIEMNFRNPIT
ncbi:MAG: glycoside hydrolase family 3 protein, partial [Clostridiales bacterium]|nr:glycoside hydrolase family 3 protein [Clostridiales bacterium]